MHYGTRHRDLTIADTQGRRPIFNDMQQSLNAVGVHIEDIRTAARVRVRGPASLVIDRDEIEPVRRSDRTAAVAVARLEHLVDRPLRPAALADLPERSDHRADLVVEKRPGAGADGDLPPFA